MSKVNEEWIKLMARTFDNDKIKIIESMPEGYQILVIWMKLLVQARKINDGGEVYFRKNIPYTSFMLATLWNHKQHIIEIALATFQKFGMIQIDTSEMIFITNWNKYQNTEGLDRIRELAAIRNKNLRDRKKLTAVGVSATDDTNDVTRDVMRDVTLLDNDAPRSKNLEKEFKNKHLDHRYKNRDNRCAESFDTFWSTYPKKMGRAKAWEKWQMYFKRGEIDIGKIIAGTEAYIRYIDHQRQTRKDFNESFVKHGVTFVNGKGWDDDWTIPAATSTRRNNVVTADDPDPYGIAEQLRNLEERRHRNNNDD